MTHSPHSVVAGSAWSRSPRCRFAVLVALAVCSSAAAVEIHISSAATGNAQWSNTTTWDTGTVPTAADAVVFDLRNNPSGLNYITLHGTTGTLNADSLAFGSAFGTPLGAFTFRNSITGTSSRNLALTTGAITVASQVTGTITLSNANAGNTTFLAGDGSFEVTNNSTQTLQMNMLFADNGATSASMTLSAPNGGLIAFGTTINTYSGGTVITGGTQVTMGSASNLGTGAVGVGAAASLDLGNISSAVTIAGLNDVSGSGGTVTRSTTTSTRTLTLTGSGTYAFSGTLTTAGTASQFALSLTGGGTQKLSGASTYGGTTSITSGTLLANNTTGSATGTGSISLGAGGVLGGTGSVAGLVTTAAVTSTFSPGDSNAATFTAAGGLKAQNGATFNFELGTVADKIAITGGTFTGSTNAGDMVFNFSNAGGLAVATAYTLFDYSGSVLSGLDTADFALSAASISAGFVLDSGFGTGGWFIDSTNKLVQVQFSAIPASSVPEPGAIGLLAGFVILGSTLGLRRIRPRT